MLMAQTHADDHAQIGETVRHDRSVLRGVRPQGSLPRTTQTLWKDRSSVVIDEPELGLHPYAIKLLARLLHEAGQRGQLVISTQAPLLLDELTPEQVIVVNHHDGESVCKGLNSGKLSDWHEGLHAGPALKKQRRTGPPPLCAEAGEEVAVWVFCFWRGAFISGQSR